VYGYIKRHPSIFFPSTVVVPHVFWVLIVCVPTYKEPTDVIVYTCLDDTGYRVSALLLPVTVSTLYPSYSCGPPYSYGTFTMLRKIKYGNIVRSLHLYIIIFVVRFCPWEINKRAYHPNFSYKCILFEIRCVCEFVNVNFKKYTLFLLLVFF